MVPEATAVGPGLFGKCLEIVRTSVAAARCVSAAVCAAALSGRSVSAETGRHNICEQVCLWLVGEIKPCLFAGGSQLEPGHLHD